MDDFSDSNPRKDGVMFICCFWQRLKTKNQPFDSVSFDKSAESCVEIVAPSPARFSSSEKVFGGKFATRKRNFADLSSRSLIKIG